MANCKHLLVNSELVDKVLEQGQRLRSSMIESILENDPLFKTTNYTQRHNADLHKPDTLEAYLRGDPLSEDDQTVAFDSIKTLNAKQLSDITNRIFCSKCKCNICMEYDGIAFKDDTRRKPSENKAIYDINETFPSEEHKNYLKYVDSLKINVHSLSLNETGNRKVGNQVPFNQTFFIEYRIPSILLKNVKNKSKVDSGLDSNGVVRICSRRRRLNEDLSFRHTSIHDVENVPSAIEKNISIDIFINYRNPRQKNAPLFGCAKFYLNSFEYSENLICNRGIIVQLDENTPLELGILKISVQLGCGRLYFGKEFLNSIQLHNVSPIILDSDDSACQSSDFVDKEAVVDHRKPERIQEVTRKAPRSPKKSILKPVQSISKPVEEKKHILFGFIYISEVNYLTPPVNSYVTCRPFCQESVFSSRVVLNNTSPVFNFCQVIPLILDDELLLKFRENYTLVEFWKKTDINNDSLIGFTKIPLQQFYTTYRNPLIIQYLQKNKLPTIATDWWEPIQTAHDELIGQVQILVALGTEEQVKNLKTERGFRTSPVKAKFSKPLSNVCSVSVATQFSSKKMEEKPVDQGRDDISSFLTELMTKNKTVVSEKGTNTESVPEPNANSSKMKKTTDLLDSLEKVLSKNNEKKAENRSFKAQIYIDNALHLPCRKKSKSKKSRSKCNKSEENLLPSTYVTFETNGETKFTPIVHKSCSPKWDFKCDVSLPVELLINSNNRLIFKVWRKATNAVKQPNLQTDTVLGFAGLDLTVLLAGLPNVQGWFNITDFTKKCNGQINIHVTPLEDVSRYQSEKQTNTNSNQEESVESEAMDEPSELLSRALKRKFTELDEITQRLRLRLSKVTNDEEEDNSNDEIADEFERDINTLCIEEDFNMVNFTDDSHKSKSNNYVSLMEVYDNKDRSTSSSELTVNGLDTDLVEGKQRIDTLLEKLSILSADATNTFTNRYVSGCSTSQENNSSVNMSAILQHLDHSSRPNIQASVKYDPNMFQKIFTSSQEGDSNENSNSVSSSFSECRRAPDGEGNLDKQN